MKTEFRKQLLGGRPLIGTLVTLPSPEIAELLATAGFDWLFVDLEHGALDPLCAQRILQAAGAFVPCLVRVPSLEEAWIKKCLDIGADGIILPHIMSAEEAERAVRLCKYPPAGQRSVGVARAHGYGRTFSQTVADANETVAVVVQIEHIRAVENIDAIAAVAGIDALFIGPYDLSASMNRTGQVDAPEVVEAIAAVRRRAQSAKIPLGIFAVAPETAAAYLDAGYTLVAVGLDTLLLLDAVRRMLPILKK
jgi:2-dehydro-3-deoxyglucarate aldolase/4-hydroxy-2-oxoheptanedioate aldolase